MIERVEWQKHPNELSSPFIRGPGERPLRLTLHSQCLTNLTENEETALALLDELSNLKEVQLFSTSPGKFPHIVLEEPAAEDDWIPVALKRGGSADVMISSAVWFKHLWTEIAAGLAPGAQRDHKDIVDQLLLAEAHTSIWGDILVTKSPFLLSNRDRWPVRKTHPRTPLEATRITGLFLRSRSDYTYSASSRSRRTANRGLFYWVLARYRLPNMWRYFAGCLAAAQLRGDDTDALGEAVLHRTVRALEALDAIGIRFYASRDRDDFLEVVYHFDYLTLLLAGAIDAQARIARRAYRLRTQEKSASFRREDFRNSLRENGATELYRLCSSLRYQSILTSLYELRNPIHGAAPRVIAYQDKSVFQPTHTIALPSSISGRLLEAARELGGAKEWGLASKFKEVLLEPYSYASSVVAASLSAINDVAGHTDVTRLFPDECPVPPLMEAPDDHVFDLGRRFSLMA